ncbi:MAG TPA: polysaccharide deacetylase family protein [Candidatus Saccharimonadales bacterium]|nr:polysaccharide deacetylase family protein [Candidatus Saccharimonadales bacterium]
MNTSSFALTLKHTASRLLHAYADARVGATEAEKRCHKQSDSILLTFDDYGTGEQIQALLSILKEKDTRAVFFLQGDWAAAQPELVQRIQSAGHIVGNHTFSHAVLRSLPSADMVREISTGLPGPWLRPPEGRYNKRVRRIAASLGCAICYWSIDSRDWTGASVEAMRRTILSELHPGAVILFHLHAPHTIALLPQLIDDIRAKGYQLTSHTETWKPTYK